MVEVINGGSTVLQFRAQVLERQCFYAVAERETLRTRVHNAPLYRLHHIAGGVQTALEGQSDFPRQTSCHAPPFLTSPSTLCSAATAHSAPPFFYTNTDYRRYLINDRELFAKPIPFTPTC
jgi:hypothetical protein